MKKFLLTVIFLLVFLNVFAQKTVYIPNDFKNDPVVSKQWSWDRSYQSDNFVVFWGTKSLSFSPKNICAYLEKSYEKYINEIGFCSDSSNTNLGKYKIIVMMNDTWDGGGPSGWAYGGDYDRVIGAMWVHPDATNDGYVLSHEFAHTLQCMISIQENKKGGFIDWEPGGFFWETHANFMRLQEYGNLAGEDLPRWMGTSMFHLSSTRHHYCSFKWLLHMQNIDGIEMINRLWKESIANEHPLLTLKRLKNWDQSQLNDFIFDYAKREVTCDYPLNGLGTVILNQRNQLMKNEPHYIWRFHTILTQVDEANGRYVVPDEFTPQDYGYNLIPLHPTDDSKEVRVKFKGHTEVNNSAGWRYGFVAVGGTTPRYSPVYNDDDGEISFQMNDGETALYLVVVGAPTTHTSYVWEPGWPKIKRYPYELKIDNAVPEGYQDDFRSQYKTSGSAHSNGGGWVASSAKVASSVYVGPQATVLGTSKISGNVRIENTAWVENATIKDNVVISGNANVWNGTYSGNAQIMENAVLSYCTVSGNAIIKGDAIEWGITFGGSVVVGGDAEVVDASSGVYLQCPHTNNGRTENDGKDASHYSNQDINASYELFSDSEMEFDNPSDVTNWAANSFASFQLAQNYPNPFNPTTTINYELPELEQVSLSIFNINGQLVRTLVHAQQGPGNYTVIWDGSNERGRHVSSGIYFYKLSTEKETLTKRMLLLR